MTRKHIEPLLCVIQHNLKLFSIIIILSFFVIMACGASMDGNNLIITKNDNGKSFEVKEGAIFQIELEGAGATGYWWYLDKLDTTYAELISEETTTLKKEGGLVGETVTGMWRIRVKKEGVYELTMHYYRLWEGAENSIESFSIKLNIKP